MVKNSENVQRLKDIVQPQRTTSTAKKHKDNELNGKMLHIKVGVPSWNNQLVETEVNKVEEKIVKLLEENNIDCLVLVTHYGVDVKLIEPANPKKVSSSH